MRMVSRSCTHEGLRRGSNMWSPGKYATEYHQKGGIGDIRPLHRYSSRPLPGSHRSGSMLGHRAGRQSIPWSLAGGCPSPMRAVGASFGNSARSRIASVRLTPFIWCADGGVCWSIRKDRYSGRQCGYPVRGAYLINGEVSPLRLTNADSAIKPRK